MKRAGYGTVTDRQIEETAMPAISKAVSLLAISVALTLSGSHVFAQSGVSPGQVNTSGISAPQDTADSWRPRQRCGLHPLPPCPLPPPQGATSGNDERGVADSHLHQLRRRQSSFWGNRLSLGSRHGVRSVSGSKLSIAVLPLGL